MQPIIDKYRQIVVDNGGEVVVVNKWDKRRLAYEVKGRNEGIYIVMNFKSEPAASAELERVMKISEDVLRHIIVRDEIPPQPQSAPAQAVEHKAEVETKAEAEVETEAEIETKVEAVVETVAEVETKAETEVEAKVEA